MNQGQESPFARSSKIQRSPQQQKVNPRYPTTYPTERTRSQTTTPPAIDTEVTQKSKLTPTFTKEKKKTEVRQSPGRTTTETTNEETENTANNRADTPTITSTTGTQTEETQHKDKWTQKTIHTQNTAAQIPQAKVKNPSPDRRDKNTKITQIETQNKLQPANQNKTNRTIMEQKDIQRNIATFVPEFSGENTANRENDLARFLGTADSINDMLTTEEEQKIFSRLIKFRLTGDAYIRIIHKDIKDYKSLKTILKQMYQRTMSLNEMEQNFSNIRQNYGETIRNYGYRLIEALDKYRDGYRTKYHLEHMDPAYDRHLNETAVQIFKKGLNSIVLRDKIVTIRATTIDEIMEETEITEKMMRMTNGTQIQTPPVNTHQNLNTQPQYTQNKIIICNYCQKANHTWDVCRSRLYRESITQRNAQYTQGTQITNIPYTRQQPNTYNTQRTHLGSNGNQQPQRNFNNQNNYARYIPAQYHLPATQYNQPTTQVNNTNQFQTKYCTYCKTTRGHTYEECRNKLRQNENQQQTNYNNTPRNNFNQQVNNPTTNPRFNQNTTFNNATRAQPPDTNHLEQMFNNMKINMIAPQQQRPHENNQEQGNANGSSQ